MPFQLRLAMAATVARVENNFAWSRDGRTNVTILTGSYRFLEPLAAYARLAGVGNWPAGAPPDSAYSLVNPIVGLAFAQPLPSHFRFFASLALSIPVGMGGGDNPDPDLTAANRAGAFARAAMDNSLFAVNDFAVILGMDFAWVAHGVTVQVEATVFQLTRVRGKAPSTPDASRTNFSCGGFLGGFVMPVLSIGTEVRYQRWLSTPVAVANDPTLRDNLSVALGARGHVQLAEKVWLRPGFSWALGLLGALESKQYQVVQADVFMNF